MAVSTIRVMIAHGTPLVCAGLEAALRAQGDFEIVSSGCERGCAMPEETYLKSVSVVVADCEIGVQLAVSGGSSGRRVLIITQDETEASIRGAMKVGARGYLLLTSSLDAVVGAIRSVHSGGTALDPIVATKMVDSFAGLALTRRELEVTALRRKGRSRHRPSRILAVPVLASASLFPASMQRGNGRLELDSRELGPNARPNLPQKCNIGRLMSSAQFPALTCRLLYASRHSS